MFRYGTRERGWDLIISAEGRADLNGRGAPDWTQTVFTDMDGLYGGLSHLAVAERAEQFVLMASKEDPLRLALADLTPWIDIFATNDRKLRRIASRATLRYDLDVTDIIKLVARMNIESDEAPLRAPAESNPLVANQWWAAAHRLGEGDRQE